MLRNPFARLALVVVLGVLIGTGTARAQDDARPGITGQIEGVGFTKIPIHINA